MKTFLSLGITAVLLAASPALKANKSYAPLPAMVFSGKTVFIENSTGDATLQHSVYMELARWGRFRLAESRENADIVLAISGPSSVRVVPASESSSGYPPPARSDAPAEPSVPAGFTRISIVDPKTGKSLWFSQNKTDLSKSRTAFLDGLRDAMEQQESGRRHK
jgi:hypothetical protein